MNRESCLDNHFFVAILRPRTWQGELIVGTRTGIIVMAALATAGGSPSVALAQSTTEDQIGEIVVTAQRRDESLQDTPISVTALTAEALEGRQISNVLDIANQVPNLNIEAVVGLGNSARVFLRGVGEDQAQFNADPAVGVYVDGVYYARTNGALFDFLDIERVEVLRGPQGTLYGRNTPGGAINVITRRPDADRFGFTGEMLFGRFDQMEARASVNVPMGEGLAASASFLAKSRDGLSRSTSLNRNVGRREVISARGSIAYDPTPDLRMRLTLDRTWDNSDTGIPTSNFAGPPDDLFVTEGSVIPRGRFRSNGVALDVEYDIGAVTLRSISAYRDLDQTAILDNDGEARLYSGFESDAKQSQFSQEITASLTTDRLNLIIGGYFFDENNDYDALTLIGSRTNPATRIARPDFSEQFTRSYAIFGQATYELFPAFELTIGGRYTWDSKRFANDQPSVPAVYRAERKWQDFSPKVGVDYRLSEGLFVYASFAEGYKAGGFNRSNVRVVAETPYDQERVRSYEIGLKSDLFNRRLRLNLNGFYNDYTDLQLSSFDPNTGTTRRFNAAQATTKGVELEASARPARGLDIYGTVAYLDAQYDEFFDLVGGQLVDVSFRKLKGAPKWQASGGFSYEVDLGSGSVRLNGDAGYRGRIFNNVANTPAIATEGRTLVNASIAYLTEDERWTFTLAGRNLLDKKYPANGIFIGGLLSALYPADPLTWSVSARYRF
jgi:iron complex outermembrane receptor protein